MSRAQARWWAGLEANAAVTDVALGASELGLKSGDYHGAGGEW
jgi:hypothetical protein